MTPEENARLEAIERRLASLETRLAPPRAPASEPPPAPAAAAEPSPAPPPPEAAGPTGTSGLAAGDLPPLAQPIPGGPDGHTERPPHTAGIETAVGLAWLSRLAVLTIVLALAFFFKYAFENQWIGEWGRVLLGTGCGLAGLALGERCWRGGQGAYGQALSAAGIAFLYLSFWAAFALYQLVSQPSAFALMVLATIAAAALALRYDSPAVAMLGLAGGFATPLLLGSARDPWFVLGYVLILDLGASAASRYRRWRWLEALAVAGTVILYVRQAPVPLDLRLLYTTFVIAWYGLFAASEWPPVFMAAQVFAGLAMVQIWEGGAGALLAVLLVAGAGLVAGALRGWSAVVTTSWIGFWLAYGAWSTESGHPPAAATMALLTLSFLLFLSWPVWLAVARRQALAVQCLVVMALNAAFYFGAGYALLRPDYSAWEGLFAVAVGVAQMAAARLLWRKDASGSLLAAGAAWALLVLAVPVQFAGYRITIAWALEGAALAWMGARLGDRRPATASLAVFLLVLTRLANLDSSMFPRADGYNLLANARFVTFAVAAAALWAAAWWTHPGRRALAAYLGGLVVMLWGLSLEAAGWAARIAAPQDFRSVASTAISVLAAAYAVVLVAGGVARRSPVTRVAGIVLIGFVFLKLYLYDVWLLAHFYRMVAFAILGLLLLAMSYLYSRFRGSIQNWRRPQA